jgi:hypothetical protein
MRYSNPTRRQTCYEQNENIARQEKPKSIFIGKRDMKISYKCKSGIFYQVEILAWRKSGGSHMMSHRNVQKFCISPNSQEK